MSRAELLAELTEEIHARGARRIGIDGVDGAGKTWLADELADRIDGATRIRADDFLNPPEIRYRLGRDSPDGFFLDSFDYDRFGRAVGDAGGSLVIADGIFLHRDELAGLWDYSIWLEVRCSPRSRATVVVDNSDLADPIRIGG